MIQDESLFRRPEPIKHTALSTRDALSSMQYIVNNIELGDQFLNNYRDILENESAKLSKEEVDKRIIKNLTKWFEYRLKSEFNNIE